MAATTSYQAGVESNQLLLSYAKESAWGTLPAVQFQAIRLTGESLAGTKSRQSPNEILNTFEDSQKTTTQESAGGGINFPLTYGTNDDLWESLLASEWQAAQAIAGVSGDITITNVSSTSATLSSTTSGKFANLAAGQYIRRLGFTNAGNNTVAYVASKTDDENLTLTTPFAASVTETPAGTAAQIRASTIKNGSTFKSVFLQKKLGSALFLTYPGAFASAGTLAGGTGQFLNGSLNFIAKSETEETSDQSTGTVLAAPAGRPHDPVGGFKGILVDNALISAVVDQFSLNIQRNGAAGEYGMGSEAAQGILMGSFGVSGSMRMYFRDFTLYDRFKAETQGKISFVTSDPAGNIYVVTVLNAALMNPQINAGGPGQAVYANFTIEGNPQTGGGTLQIDRLPGV